MIIRVLAALRQVLYPLFRVKTIGAITLMIADEKIVLIRQSYGPGLWSLPGGGIKFGESPREAALREASEETGATFSKDVKCELFGFYLREVGGWKDYVSVHVVDAWVPGTTKSVEILEVKEFPLDDLPSDIAPAVKRRIDEWKRGKPQTDRW